MHHHSIEDSNNQLVDIVELCSDSCNRQWCVDNDAEYQGWSGCHETEFTTHCQSCGVVIVGTCTIGGSEPCECQTDNVVVNRILSKDGELCEHGNWIQVPASYLGVNQPLGIGGR